MPRTIRIILGEYFQSPMSNMNFPAYINYVNTAGKITARSTMDLSTIILAAIEEQEKINEQNEQNFIQIFEILAKLVNPPIVGQPQAPKVETPIENPKLDNETIGKWVCDNCGKVLSTKLALAGHSRSHQPKK